MNENLGFPLEPKVVETRVEDFETQPRNLGKTENTILGILMVILSIFQLYTSYTGPFPDLIQRSIHLLFVLPAAFVMYPPSEEAKRETKSPLQIRFS